MKSLEERMADYTAYHRNRINCLAHVIGVPMVVFSVLLFLSWFRFIYEPLPITAATLFYAAVVVNYFMMDLQIALLQLPFTLALLLLADHAAHLDFMNSLECFLAAFFGGWTFQLLGHVVEGRRPALVDNISQVFNAPVFLVTEGLFLMGIRTELRDRIDVRLSKTA